MQSIEFSYVLGESMVASTVEKLLPYCSANVQVYNVYGPAETSMATTVYRVQPKDLKAKFVPIGHPLPNYSCHILGKDLCPMPVGFVGELFIGGPAVFEGYKGGDDGDNDRLKSLNNSALVNIPAFQYQSNKNSHNKFYRTGDLCRLNEDGEIIFVGRVDHQVKLRGQRVELGEIEACIRTAHPEIEVRNCIVVKCVDELTHREYLTAYVEPAYGTSTENYNIIQESITKACMQRLPAHMVPSSWLLLESLPLNTNNKIDRKQLPLVPLSKTKTRKKSARQLSINYNDYLEDVLSEIFSSALNTDLDNNQHHKSFIELGGSSLNAITIVNLIRERLYAEMEIHLLFKNPNISALANILQSKVIKLFTPIDNDEKSEDDVIIDLIEGL